ncbi:MAG: ABC transporter ATP-binding protein [Chloroflexota bacterium]|nr:ABC transporter ATP-binding protein [Chloroflexota bacterium]
MAAITLEGVSKVLSGARWELHLSGSEAGGRTGAPTFPEDDRSHEEGAAQGVRALDGVDLHIRDGETLGVIGPSGCGKSTLLRVIAGLEAPDAGRVLYDAEDVARLPPGERGIGMVFQNYALYPHMKGRGNLGFFFRIRRRAPEIDERVRITAEIMGLGFEELLDRKPGTLSGGQQQRLAIGRCISRDPRLFLLDEPLSNLDARLRARTRVELKRLLARFRITTVYVTHDQSEAFALASRLAVMRRGRIEQIGTYAELYQRPSNAFVAGFLGTPPANLVPGTVAQDPGAAGTVAGHTPGADPTWAHVPLPGGALPLPERWRGIVAPGQAVLVGMRPEHLRIVTPDVPGLPATPGALGHSGTSGAPGAPVIPPPVMAGTVVAVEPLLAERAQLVHVALESAGRDSAEKEGAETETEVTVRAPLEPPIEHGRRVVLAITPDDALLFDAVTGRTLAE